ncbi:VWA-like domain-containing protein [Sulfurimonas sp.]|uniref:vWA domain-containing protein n=1 Tax=Sulfurimonas sp. TaxID=2022749 RepID=UPI00262F3E54|nr:VWA-like domain-containing protein [Sulfurimonas sp.]MDD5157336.1 VWA-like domain-containing protein [Sulfurimonas sp.]
MIHLEQKISQAKAKLLVNYPFFGVIASKLELILNNDIQASKSNGKTLEYNEDFFARLTLDEMEFIFANGAMHASLSHENRRGQRSSWLWQLSTDYAINDMLVENGFSRPDEAHYSKRFVGLYAEEIYEQLKEDILRDELEYEADDKDDIKSDEQNQNEDEQKNKTPQESENGGLKEQLFMEEALALLDAEIKKGDAPKGINRFFNLSYNSKIDWRDELKVALERFHKDDFTLLPPSKKFLHMGVYLPSSTSQRVKLVIAVDSSGSVDEKLLNTFLNEVDFMMSLVQNYQIELLVCDDKIRSHTTFYSGDTLEVNLIGGGATDFRAVFEFVEKELDDVNLLLYFSDLDGIFPDKEPLYQVKWISPKDTTAPFGTVLVID